MKDVYRDSLKSGRANEKSLDGSGESHSPVYIFHVIFHSIRCCNKPRSVMCCILTNGLISRLFYLIDKIVQFTGLAKYGDLHG